MGGDKSMFENVRQQLQTFLEQRQHGLLRVRGSESSIWVLSELLGELATTWERGPILRFLQPFEDEQAYVSSLLEQLRAEWTLSHVDPTLSPPGPPPSPDELLEELFVALSEAEGLPSPSELEELTETLRKPPSASSSELWFPDMPETLHPKHPATPVQVVRHWLALRDMLPSERPALLSLVLLPSRVSEPQAFRRCIESLLRAVASAGGLRRLRLILLEPKEAPFPAWMVAQSPPTALELELTPQQLRSQLELTLGKTAKEGNTREHSPAQARQRIVSWLALGQLEQTVEAHAAAHSALMKGWQEARALGEASLEALALYQLSLLEAAQGRHFEALEQGLAALEPARAQGGEALRVLLLLHLTELLLRARQWKEAVGLAHEGVLLTTLLGQLPARHSFLARMGAGLQKLGEVKASQACLNAARQVRTLRSEQRQLPGETDAASDAKHRHFGTPLHPSTAQREAK